MTGDTDSSPTTIDTTVIRDYLLRHPTFLRDNPDLLPHLHLTENSTTSRVVDFRDAAMSILQERVKDAQRESRDIADYSRSRSNIRHRIKHAIRDVVAARTLEQLMEHIGVDFPLLFDVDVARLGLESELGNGYESYHPEEYYSGLSLLPVGHMRAIFDDDSTVRLSPDSALDIPWMHDIMFHHCTDLVKSSIYLLLPLPRTGRMATLGMGVRDTGRFQPGQDDSWYSFFADILALRLDAMLTAEQGVL